jgi:hypothetical protein
MAYKDNNNFKRSIVFFTKYILIKSINKVILSHIFKKSLLAYLVNKYISDLLCLENYRMRIISIAKSTILGAERVKIGHLNIGHVYLPRTSSIDFSSIKSLTLGKFDRINLILTF